jgi:amino acid adenylation domain-containing protein
MTQTDVVPAPPGAGTETLLSLFADTVGRVPNRPAVSDDNRRMSYAELDAVSDALAQTLLDWGVRRDDRVAIHLWRGVDVVAAMLGILKAGAAYVPVDMSYPPARRDLMIRAGGVQLVITAATGPDVLQIGGAEALAWQSDETGGGVPPVEVTGSDLACVLFTSGSSGTPKAIMLEHRNLVHLARNRSLAELTSADRFGQVSSVSFDAFHVETWCSIAAGAEVAVLPPMAELIARDLERELRRRRITAMLVPTMAVNHVVHEDRKAFASLRVMYTGGDVLQPAAARALISGGFGGELWNLYGPTEITTCCTGHRIREVSEDCDSVPIGRPLDGVSAYVLDIDLTEAAAGEVGELHVGGAGVTRGYLGQPALTADRFRPDPSGPPGSRMYATGDLAVRRADGELEFRGRADDQVKIRGYRVEPREAERAIIRHPGVRAAAVMVAGSDQDRSLIALVVPTEKLSPGELREFVTGAVPAFLVPRMFVMVPEIPGNQHGKRDLVQLRRIADDHLARDRDRVEPRDEVEAYLAKIWAELLAVEWVSVNDDFFGLGGNSMLAFRARMRIKRDMGVELDVAEIFERSELAEIAGFLRQRLGESDTSVDGRSGRSQEGAVR